VQQQVQEIPNSEQAVAERSDAFIKMLTELNTVILGAYNTNYTARGQNLRPLIKQTLRFARSIFPVDSTEWKECSRLMTAWLADEAVGATKPRQKRSP